MYIYIYICCFGLRSTQRPHIAAAEAWEESRNTPNIPTKIIPAKVCRLRTSRRFPMDMGGISKYCREGV